MRYCSVLLIILLTGLCHGQQPSMFDAPVITYTEVQQLNLAEQGSAVAQVYVGWMYETGKGVPSNSTEAIKWYQKAADQGNDDAKRRIMAMTETRSSPSEPATIYQNVLIAGFWAYVLALILAFLVPNPSSTSTKSKPIGGWLTFFWVMLMFLSPMLSLGQLEIDRQQITTLAPAMLVPLIVESSGIIAFVIYGVFIGMKIRGRSPRGIQLAHQYLLVRLFVLPAISIISLMLLPENMRNGWVVVVVAREIVIVGAWWLYFAKSKRVKETYGQAQPSFVPQPEKINQVTASPDVIQFSCPACGNQCSLSKDEMSACGTSRKPTWMFRCLNCGKSIDIRQFIAGVPPPLENSSTDAKTEAERQLYEILGISTDNRDMGREEGKAEGKTKLEALMAKVKSQREEARQKQAKKKSYDDYIPQHPIPQPKPKKEPMNPVKKGVLTGAIVFAILLVALWPTVDTRMKFVGGDRRFIPVEYVHVGLGGDGPLCVSYVLGYGLLSSVFGLVVWAWAGRKRNG